jgi:Secretion system C-terminal sorting domain
MLTENTASVVANTNCWHITSNIGNDPLDVWIPNIPNNVSTPYSCHLYDAALVSLSDLENEKIITALPNPADEKVRFNYLGNKEFKNAELTIYNSIGSVMDNIYWNSSSTPLLVDTRKYTSGIYFFKFRSENDVTTKKIIIK